VQPERPVAWVTGAAGGIGRAVVDALREAGLRVLATDLLPPQVTAVPGVEWLPLDVTDETAVAGFARTLERAGPCAAVIHLAGRAGRGPLTAISSQEWRELLEVNLTSAFLVARAAHPALRAGRGSLLLCASSNGLNGGSALSGPAYAVAKAGIINLTRYLAREWAADGVRVNCIAPGPIDTPMLERLDDGVRAGLAAATLVGRVGRPEDVAATIRFLCSDQASFITGTVHNLSGGLVLD
jgi:NAD(P)-dependent dehydrogenase (short-subunit alcohol dehydrogenase family)